MKTSGGGSVRLTAVSKKIGSEWGREVKMLGENFAPDMLAPNTNYSRFSQFAKSKDPIYTILAIDQQGQVALLRFQAAPAAVRKSLRRLQRHHQASPAV
jgi:hypothetical protein